MIIILWTGSVLLGACSMKRRAESTRATSTAITGVEGRSVIRQDSLGSSLDRVVHVDRQWLAVSPRTGVVYRYRERIHLDEEAHASGGRSIQETARSQHQVNTESYGHHRGESGVESSGIGWWWLVVAGGIASAVALRLFRFWPFK